MSMTCVRSCGSVGGRCRLSHRHANQKHKQTKYLKIEIEIESNLIDAMSIFGNNVCLRIFLAMLVSLALSAVRLHDDIC